MLFNTVLFLILTFLCYTLIPVTFKYFGKIGLMVYSVILIIISNITAASIGPMLLFEDVTLANVTFSAIFVINNILSIKYDKQSAIYSNNLNLFCNIISIMLLMICSYLVASPYDTVTSHIHELFKFGSYSMCNTIVSVTLCYLANNLNINFFNKLLDKFSNKNKLLFHNISVIISNCIENFAFVYIGLYLLPTLLNSISSNLIAVEELIDFRSCTNIAMTTCVFEILLAFLSDPFFKFTLNLNPIIKSNKEINSVV